jgi:hypothetical protein
MILTAGKTNVEKLLGGDADGKKIVKIGVGTSDTPVSTTDGALTGAVIKDITNVTYLANNVVQFETLLEAGDTAMTIKEIGLYNEDDVLVHRKVITPKAKVAGVQYAVTYRAKVI